jgi:hypothetical protein
LAGGAAALVVAGLATIPSGASTAPRLVTRVITMELPTAFTPVAPKGATDLYHCSLLNPKVTVDQMITQAQFIPGNKPEVHHAVLYWVPPNLAAAARTANNNGRGWTCFGGPNVPGAGQQLGSSIGASWLAGWSPGHGPGVEPKGTGMPLPAGSLIIMQVHYNLLAGHGPDRSKVVLTVTNEKGSGLLPLKILLYAAPIDVPCPAGVHGTLCVRANSLADIGRRFGQSAVSFDNLLQGVCGQSKPVPGDVSNCTWTINPLLPAATPVWKLYAITPHMHLLGVSMQVTLNPGTPQQRNLLPSNPPIAYDFHYQRSYALSTPLTLTAGDRLKVSCTYNPKLRQELPILKPLPPRYILWADGSSDEMCLSVLTAVAYGATPQVRLAGSSVTPGAMQWPVALTAAMERAARVDDSATSRAVLNQLMSHLAHCAVS